MIKFADHSEFYDLKRELIYTDTVLTGATTIEEAKDAIIDYLSNHEEDNDFQVRNLHCATITVNGEPYVSYDNNTYEEFARDYSGYLLLCIEGTGGLFKRYSFNIHAAKTDKEEEKE